MVGPTISETPEVPDTVGAATLVAVTVTLVLLDILAGAVYVPVEVIVPVLGAPPRVPFTDHTTEESAPLQTWLRRVRLKPTQGPP